MKRLLTIFALCAASLLARGYSHSTAHQSYTRSPIVRRSFMRANPCPSTGRAYGACKGYVVDHVNPLACGGADSISNMQWQTIAAGKVIELKALKLEPGCTYAIELQRVVDSDGIIDLRRSLEIEAERIGVKLILIGPHIRIKRESIGALCGLALRRWMIKRGWIEGPLVYLDKPNINITNHSSDCGQNTQREIYQAVAREFKREVQPQGGSGVQRS